MIDLSRKYHVITAKDELLISTNDFHQAWLRIKGQKHGTRLIRNDGEMLAYASTAAGGRVKRGFPKRAVFVGETKKEAPEGTPLV